MYAFAHIDKTAGRTVRAVLRRSFGAGHCEIRTPYARRPADRNDRSVCVTGDDLRRVRRWASSSATHDFQTKTLAGEASAQKAIDLLASRVGFVGLTEAFDESLLMLGQWLGEPDFRPEYRPVNRLADKQRARDAARTQADLGYLDAPDVRARLSEMNALDQQVSDWSEPLAGRLLRNWVYKEELHAVVDPAGLVAPSSAPG